MAGYLEGKRVRVRWDEFRSKAGAHCNAGSASGVIAMSGIMNGYFHIVVIDDDGMCQHAPITDMTKIEILEPETTKPDLSVDAFGMGEPKPEPIDTFKPRPWPRRGDGS